MSERIKTIDKWREPVRPYLNTGKGWSQMDDEDLQLASVCGMRLSELCVFLQRSKKEVIERLGQLKLRTRDNQGRA